MSYLKSPRLVRPCIALAVAGALAGCAASFHHRAGLNAMRKGDFPAAVTELEQAAKLEPLDVEYQRDWLVNRDAATRKLLARAERARAKGNLNEAGECYRTILKYELANARALAGLNEIAEMAQASENAAQAKAALKNGEGAEALRFAHRTTLVPGQSGARLSGKWLTRCLTWRP